MIRAPVFCFGKMRAFFLRVFMAEIQDKERNPTMTARYSRTRKLVEGALMIAMSTVLSMIPLFKMPYGGSVTLLSMLPLILMSCRHGAKWGLFTAFVHGVLQLLLGLENLTYCATIWSQIGCILLDYLLAFTALGLASTFARPFRNRVLGLAINLLRSIPFIILLIMILPLTKLIVGKVTGPNAVVVPLVISASPYIARMVESSLKEVNAGVIEAAKSMGASTMQIIWKVLLPEAKPSLLVGAAISITTILGYSTMAGYAGGGGLGDIAIRYGFYRYETEMMLVTVVLLVIIVQLIQIGFMHWSRGTDKRIR